MRVARAAAPTDGKFGMVVISHGSGGDALATVISRWPLRRMAMSLPRQCTHETLPGHVGCRLGERVGRSARQVSRVIDPVTGGPGARPHIQRERIGVVGHSAGGYTALALAGAQPSMNVLVQHCKGTPEDARFCFFGGAPLGSQPKGGDIPDVHDRRVRAIVLLAPVAALFTDEALSNLTVPVRIYGAERDDLTPVKYHAERLAKALAPKAEYVLIKGAGHFSFLASFPDALRNSVGEAGQDPSGFDRNAMHETLNPEIVAFFNRTLKINRDEAYPSVHPTRRKRAQVTSPLGAFGDQANAWNS